MTAHDIEKMTIVNNAHVKTYTGTAWHRLLKNITMILEILLQLIDPLVAVFHNRKSRRKQRLEHFWEPVFKEMTGAHNDCIRILNKTLYITEEAQVILTKSKQEKNRLRKRRYTVAYKRKLNQAREQLKKERSVIESRCTRMTVYHHLRKKRKLKGEEAAYLEKVLAYFSILSEDDRESYQSTTITCSYFIKCLDGRMAVAQIQDDLTAAINHHEILYENICVEYGNLQSVALGSV